MNPLKLVPIALTLITLSAHASGPTVCQFALSGAEYSAGLPSLRVTLEQTNEEGFVPDQNGNAVAIYNIEAAGTREPGTGSLDLGKAQSVAEYSAGKLAASLYPDAAGSKAVISQISLEQLVARIKSDDRVAAFVLSTISTTVRNFEPGSRLYNMLMSSFAKNMTCR
jgi:hypothetical protein